MDHRLRGIGLGYKGFRVRRFKGYVVRGFGIRGFDMIHFMIFIYGRMPFFSPFVFFFIFDAMSGGNKENEQALYVETLSIVNFFFHTL